MPMDKHAPANSLTSAWPKDVSSTAAITGALYDVISGPAEQGRDWARFRSLFEPGTRLIAYRTEHRRKARGPWKSSLNQQLVPMRSKASGRTSSGAVPTDSKPSPMFNVNHFPPYYLTKKSYPDRVCASFEIVPGKAKLTSHLTIVRDHRAGRAKGARKVGRCS